MYAKSFMELCSFEGRTGDRETLKSFCEVLEDIRRRHENSVEQMAQGILELKEEHPVDPPTENRIQYFLDRFYMSRIGSRMLLNQHSTLFGEDELGKDMPGMVGMIDERCQVRRLVVDAHDAAGIICEQYYQIFPELNVTEVSRTFFTFQNFTEFTFPNKHRFHFKILL